MTFGTPNRFNSSLNCSRLRPSSATVSNCAASLRADETKPRSRLSSKLKLSSLDSVSSKFPLAVVLATPPPDGFEGFAEDDERDSCVVATFD